VKLRTLVVPALLATAAAASRVSAQDARLAARLDPPTSAAVAAVVDSARREGLPAEPLVQRALEGSSKGAAGPRITASVRALRERLRTAREALGPAAPEADLVAGAQALAAGLDPGTLARLRALRPRGALALHLVVLADLVQKGVRPGAASSLVLDMARSRASDADLADFQRLFEADVRAGAPPGTAAATRARGIAPRGPSAPSGAPAS
jgi:hypothetical protein